MTTPDKTASTATNSINLTGQSSLNIMIVILLAVTMLSLFGGGHAIHCVSGIFMLIGCYIHMVLHRQWIKAVILETRKNMTPALRLRGRLFWAMLLSGFLCGASGLGALLLIHDPYIFLPALCCGAPIHIGSGLTFFGLSIYHIILHRNWFATRMGR